MGYTLLVGTRYFPGRDRFQLGDTPEKSVIDKHMECDKGLHMFG